LDQLDDSATMVSKTAPVEASNVHESRMRRWVHTRFTDIRLRLADKRISAQLCGRHPCALQPHFWCAISNLSPTRK